jgi:hypothetical protein
MNLENPGLPPFEPALSRLYDLAQTNGTSELEKRGYRLPDVETNVSARRIFLRACHYGYDLAQRQIAAAVIEMEHQISDLNATLKEQRRKRDSTTLLEELIRTVRNRQITLRRLIDSILYAMIRQENWLLRRFTIDLEIHNIDPIVLERTVRMAVDRNREDRMKFNLVCDLSTVIQIGDLMEIDFAATAAHKWKIIELKTGKMNEILSSLIEKDKNNQSEGTVENVKNTLGPKAARQTHRMLRQVGRMNELERIATTDQGLDPSTGVETFMTSDVVALDNYYIELKKVYDKTKQQGTAGLEISECLRIFGITREEAGGRARGIAAHQFFHMAHRDRSCGLASSNATAKSEELKLLNEVPYFVDIAAYNLNVSIADPIFSWPERQLIFDLIMSRISIFVQFDFEAFFRFAKKNDVTIGWIKGKDAEPIKKFSRCVPGTEDSWGILVQLDNGERMTFLAGFLSRVYANFTTPRQLIKLITNTKIDLLNLKQKVPGLGPYP